METAACAYAATVRKRRGLVAPAAELPNIETGLAEDSTSRCKFDNFRSAEDVRRDETDTCHFFIGRIRTPQSIWSSYVSKKEFGASPSVKPIGTGVGSMTSMRRAVDEGFLPQFVAILSPEPIWH